MGRQKGRGLIVEILKLSIPVHVPAAFPYFTVGLQAESQFTQTVGNHMRACRMPAGFEPLRQMAQAFRCPSQWPHRIAPRGRFHQSLEIRQQGSILRTLALASSPRLAYPPGLHLLVLRNLFDATADRAAGHARDPRHHAYTPRTVGAGLRGSKPPPPPLVQNGEQFPVTLSNTGRRANHARTLSQRIIGAECLFMHTSLEMSLGLKDSLGPGEKRSKRPPYP